MRYLRWHAAIASTVTPTTRLAGRLGQTVERPFLRAEPQAVLRTGVVPERPAQRVTYSLLLHLRGLPLPSSGQHDEEARHAGPIVTAPDASFRAGVLVLASLGIAEAAPPAGKPVFIHVEGLAPTSVGQNGFVVAGDFTEGGAFYWMPTSGVTLVGGGLGTGYISRDGKAMAGTVIDLNKIQQAAKWEGGRSWRQRWVRSSPARFRARAAELRHGDECATGAWSVGAGWYGTDPANPATLFTAYRWEESTGMVNCGSTRTETTHGPMPSRRTATSWSASTPP